jgi:two-component system sensor histidine kinase ChiS
LSTKSTLKEEVNKINVLILFVVVAACLVSAIIAYWSHQNDREIHYFRQASRMSGILEESFTNVGHYLKFVGKSIVENCEKNNLEKIALFLQDKVPDDVIEKEVIAITMFDWIQPDKMYVANSIYGVFPKKINLDHRSYLDKTDQFPWKAFHSKPVIGIPSAQKVIPVGMGVIDEYGDFYGTIATGIRVDRIEEKIEAAFAGEDVIYLILDKNFELILSSQHLQKFNIKKPSVDAFVSDIKTHIDRHEDSEGSFFSSAELNKDLRYTYYKKLSNYPYFIVVGEITASNRNLILLKLLPILFAISFVGLCAIAIQTFFKIRVVNPILLLNNLAEYSHFNSDIVEIDNLSSKLCNVDEKIANERQKILDAEALKINLEEKINKRTAELSHELNIKTEFLNNVSHEIRTPVQGVTAISKGLVDHWTDFDDAKKFKFIKDIFRSSDKLFLLINNLLDASKFSAGKMTYHFESTDMKNVIKNVAEEFKLFLSDNNLQIVHEFQKGLHSKCNADSNRMCQVIRNLLSNAIKFSSSGEIKIRVDNLFEQNPVNTIERESIRVAVQDNGVGIPENEIDQIFDSFSQSSRTKTITIGSGLGLTICREIIKAHDGRIWAENNPNGVGATIFFTIPTIQRLDDKVEKIDKSKTINILLIDDEDISYSSLSLLLYGKNFNISACNSGHAALDYLNKHSRQVDLIMLDLIMPDIHGLDILKMIKQNKNLSHIPILIQSGVAGTAEIAQAMEIGAVDNIEKPFNKNLLIDKINSIIISTRSGVKS